MKGVTRQIRVLAALVAAVAALAVPSLASGAAPEVTWMRGYDAAGTPKRFDKVGVLKVGKPTAKNVLVLSPGTSAGSAYFVPLAQEIVKTLPGWQVWSVERRENLLEDQSVADRFKRGKVTSQKLFDYYLGWLADSSVQDHVALVPDADVPFARDWGMRVEVSDLRRVVKAAEARGGRVVLGGHSLGGTITTAYATWDFAGKPGVKGLDGLVFIDGGSSSTPITKDEAEQRLADLQSGSPWLAFGGIPAPFAGLFALVGSGLAAQDPDTVSPLRDFPPLPPDLRTPVPATNEAGFGYAADVKTSPSSLAAFQVHAGQLAAAGDPRPWDGTGALTPIDRYAQMLEGRTVAGTDGSAWYHPLRLTIDGGAVADGNRNPASKVLDVRAFHGDDVHVPIYAFATSLGSDRVLDAATTLAEQSDLPARKLTLVDRHKTYAHNDPSAAFPKNAFFSHLIPYLKRVP